MLHLAVTLHLLRLRLRDQATDAHDRSRAPDTDRGSVTAEHVLWAVAVITLVGIVVAALTNFISSEAGKIG